MAECYLYNAEGNTREHVLSRGFFDTAPAARVVRKIIRGLYFATRNQELADSDLIIFRDGDVRLNPEDLTRGWKEIDKGEAFRFRTHFDDYGGGIWIEFYRTQWWLALTGQAAHNLPKA